MNREELVGSREYWITKIQLDLFNQIKNYMTENQLSRTQLAEKLGVTKGYISQILNGDFDHKISKLVDLSLAIGKVPQIDYPDLHEFINKDSYSNNNSPYVFTKMVRGNQIQALPFPKDQELKQLTA